MSGFTVFLSIYISRRREMMVNAARQEKKDAWLF